MSERIGTSKADTEFGAKLIESFEDAAAFLRGEDVMGAEVDEIEDADETLLTPKRIQSIRRKVASSTRKFEAIFGVKARTMEVYERGQREPDAAMVFLLRMIERDPKLAIDVAMHPHRKAA
jgi:putative transcriptional regulator